MVIFTEEISPIKCLICLLQRYGADGRRVICGVRTVLAVFRKKARIYDR